MALSEREVHYQSQIKENQAHREKCLLEMQTLQAGLTKLQEEKTNTENELNKTINTLKQDFAKMQHELNERGKLSFVFLLSHIHFLS